jgi:MFS family permease
MNRIRVLHAGCAMSQQVPHMRVPARDPMLFAVCALGIAQITAWGTSYYCLGVLAGPIAADTGWARSVVYFGFTLALLAMGLVSAYTGRAIDRYGARRIMAFGTVLITLGLLALAAVRSEAAYLAVWIFLGVGMRLSLYDAAFAALVQVVPTRGRQAISYLTLFGAFASTVFWVLGHELEEALGWRTTLAVFAAINLAVCLPLNWYGLARKEAADAAAAQDDPVRSREGAPLAGRARTLARGLFAGVMSLNAFVFGVVAVQLVPLLEAAGLATAAAVWVASLKGVAQFGGRVVEIVCGRNLRAMTVARIAIGVLPLSFALLMLAHGQLILLVAFTALMGASQGVVTIVRGAVPLALFGPQGYGAVLGVLATPILLVNAASPTLFALVIDTWGWQVAQTLLVALSTASWLAIELMSAWYERRRR